MRNRTANPTPRRRRGEGSIGRKHGTKYGCPAAVDRKVPEHKCSAPWMARLTVTDPATGRPERLTFYGSSEREAKKQLREAEVKAATGQLVLNSPRFSEWVETWFEEYCTALKPNTRKAYRSKINLYLTPYLGSHKLDKLNGGHIDAMYRDMRKRGLAEATLRQTHMILHRCLRIAMRRDLVARNVAELVDPPSTEVKGRRGLTIPEVQKVLHEAGNDPRYWLALTTGLRQGEALALRWSDTDLDSTPATVIVRRSVSRETGVGLVYLKPKSKQSTNRVVPLVPELRARLLVKRAEAMARPTFHEDDLVFTTVTGCPVPAQDDTRDWASLLRRAGVEHTPLHAARNTAAHLLEDGGAPARVVAEILGHANVATTYGYQDGNMGAKVGAVQGLGRLELTS